MMFLFVSNPTQVFMVRFRPSHPAAAHWACAYFFATCGVAYGTVMSRIPAIKGEVGLNEAELGSALLCLGLGALTAFAGAGWTQTRIGSRPVLIFGGLAQLLAFPLVGLAENLWSLALAFYVLGLFNGTTEAAMGTQAILVERAAGRPRLSSLHALYSFGGLIGSLGGALLAGFTPLTHFCLVAVPALCPLPFAALRLLPDTPEPAREKRGFRAPPLPLLLLGFMALCCYAAEGTVGDWGALLLHQFKGASDRTAALAYAAFSATMAVCRLFGDRLRATYGDYALMRRLAVVATSGILLALFSPWAAASLAGYALMGAGQSVIVPIVFSAVGRTSGMSTGSAVAVASAMGFGGLLLAPPLIGILAQAVGLDKALWVVVALYACLIGGARLVRKN